MPETPLQERKCVPCEGGVPKLSRNEAESMLQQLDGWQLNDDATVIYRKRAFKNFVESLAFLNEVGRLAEEDQHHPDLHLTGYRNVRIELTTHAIGGLSENDFILAAKIDNLSTP
jgi:4a-hydroxytetrahydrobiopterin dehydratase